jgi:hypothetical protein
MLFETKKDGLVLPRCHIKDDGTHVGSWMCKRCHNFISVSVNNVVCAAEPLPTAEEQGAEPVQPTTAAVCHAGNAAE